jgi:hypothetical protein
MQWAAFERVWGPILVHERVDVGLAHIAFYLASLLGKPKQGQRFRVRDFLPVWMRPKQRDDERASVLYAALKAWAKEG